MSTTPWSDVFRGRPVPDSEELQRIVKLPRRDWREQAEADARRLTLAFGKGGQELFPIQAAVLRDLADLGGAFCPIQVGGGKTLVCLLAPALLKAKRPLLLVPAQLVDKTQREMEHYAKFWHLPEFLRVISYELLSRDKDDVLLGNYNPDLLMADECHRLKSTSAAVVKKVRRFRRGNPECRFLLLSGTITKRSIKDYSHLVDWCLGPGSPLPRKWEDLMDWAAAVDEIRGDKSLAAPPGELVRLLHTPELRQAYTGGDPVRAIRKAYQHRLTETPGVIASGAETLGTSLVIRELPVKLPSGVMDEFNKMRANWETPDGHPFSEASELWRHCRELANGYFYRWSPRPQDSWLLPRKEWSRFVRETLKHSRKLDSPLMVAQAAARGELGEQGLETLNAWREVRDTFKPKTEAVWMHEEMVKAAVKWGQKPGLIWVDQLAFARKLESLGFEYYGAQALNSKGQHVMDADPHKAHVVSVAACSTGQNLQKFHRNLVVSAPPTGRTYEQMLGRTHRQGQEEDEVTVDIAIACEENRASFWNAVRDAKFIEDSTGAIQKLTYADIVVGRV